MRRVLLDTHIVLWWLAGGEHLSRAARDMVGRSDITGLVSAASAWEIAIKYRAGKLEAARTLLNNFQSAIDRAQFVELPISSSHAVRAGLLPGKHKDPFDRMLIAQALVEDVAVVSNDRCFDEYGVERHW